MESKTFDANQASLLDVVGNLNDSFGPANQIESLQQLPQQPIQGGKSITLVNVGGRAKKRNAASKTSIYNKATSNNVTYVTELMREE